jgi:hypothetical protein
VRAGEEAQDAAPADGAREAGGGAGHCPRGALDHE